MGAVSLVHETELPKVVPKKEDGPNSTQLTGKMTMLEMRNVRAMEPVVSCFSWRALCAEQLEQECG